MLYFQNLSNYDNVDLVEVRTQLAQLQSELKTVTDSIEYNDEEFNGGLDLYSSQISNLITEAVRPQNISLGDKIDYQEIFNAIYSLPFVNKVKKLEFKLLFTQPQGTDANEYCSDLFVSEEVDGICIETAEATINTVDTNYDNTDPIRSYRCYKTTVSLIASTTQAPLTYTYVNKEYDDALRG